LKFTLNRVQEQKFEAQRLKEEQKKE